MRKSRFTEEQIIGILGETRTRHEDGRGRQTPGAVHVLHLARVLLRFCSPASIDPSCAPARTVSAKH